MKPASIIFSILKIFITAETLASQAFQKHAFLIINMFVMKNNFH